MRVVFMGTPDLAATILREVAACHEVVGVFTRPDAVRGRGNKLVYSPVKKAALDLDVPVFAPASFAEGEALDALCELAPDVVCVCAYGMLLPKAVLDVPRLGCLNVHTSLLPRWRGAAPIERAILANDENTGVCVMLMEEGLDTGPYCLKREVPVAGRNAPELAAVLADVGADALVEALELVERGEAVWTEQPCEGMVYANKIAKGELNPEPGDTAREFVCKVNASSAGHPARARIVDRNAAIEKARVVEDEAGCALAAELKPGQALFASKRLFAATADGCVEILGIKPDGKKSMDAKSFAGGIQGIKGTIVSWGTVA